MTKAWQQHKLGDLLTRSGEAAQPAADAEYKEITIRLWGKGVLERGRISGAAVNGRRFIARKNQFIASRIDARNGAMGIVPESLDGALVTNDFPLFEVNQEHILPQYMGWLCRTPAFVDLCARASEGTTNRVRLKEDEFLRLEIQIPDTNEQQRIVIQIDTVQQQLLAADKLRSSIDRDIASLLAVRFQETLTHAQWLPMSDVAPLVRREVAIESESNYSELGVRSFFKGAFIRRKVVGAEFTWQKLYQVNVNDLIFSNIMAWEKGIALANAGQDKCVGNHRMLTCEANPILALSAYLHYYFTTDEGFAKVYAASPGTAARNRTLTADALMGLTVPVPTLAVQRQFVELKGALEKSAAKRTEQNVTSEAILPSILNRFLG
jgi:type I restriction enzyme, S subunit